MAYLKFLSGNQSRHVDLAGECIVIGRDEDCDLVLPVKAVSRHHARISREGQVFRIEDLGSRNGTRVNGVRIKDSTPLTDGARIRICGCDLIFHAGQEPVSDSPGFEVNMAEDKGDGITIVSCRDVSVAAHKTTEAGKVDAEAKLDAVLQIGRSLSAVLDMNDVLARILNKLFDVFPQADEGFIVLCDELLQHLIPKAMKTRSGPAAGSLHISRTIVGKVLDKRLALLLTDACGDGVLACSESIVESHIRSVMCVPLVGCADKPLGILQLHTESSTNAFGQNDLDLLVSIAGAMALAVENAKLHEELVAQERLKRDLQVAREVQQGFLPVGVPVVAGYQFYALYQPALSVGGDYYDFINLPDGRLVICIGDVSGKGVSAALCMAHLASDMRLAVTTANSLAEALQMANCSLNAPWMSMRFVTLLLMELEPCQHKLTVVNAGHMAPLLREPGGTLSEIGGDKAGFPLNVVPTGENKYEAVTIDLPPGSCVFACTDGVTEAEDSNGDMLGMDRLREVVSKAPANPVAIGEAVGHSVREFAADQSQHDDLTLVCFGRMLDHNDVGPPNPLGG